MKTGGGLRGREAPIYFKREVQATPFDFDINSRHPRDEPGLKALQDREILAGAPNARANLEDPIIVWRQTASVRPSPASSIGRGLLLYLNVAESLFLHFSEEKRSAKRR